MKEASISLEWPITVNGSQVSTITMRRPSAGDMKAASHNSKSDAEAEMNLIANLCMLSPEELAIVDYVDDYPKFQDALRSFKTKKKAKK